MVWVFGVEGGSNEVFIIHSWERLEIHVGWIGEQRDSGVAAIPNRSHAGAITGNGKRSTPAHRARPTQMYKCAQTVLYIALT